MLDNDQVIESIARASDVVAGSILEGNKILMCGNGGSAADAIHLEGELVGRFQTTRKALPAIALGTSISTLTAIANDMGYKEVFARPVEALGNSGDVLICFSTSGKSQNILEAVKVAKKKKMIVIAITGNHLANPLRDSATITVEIPATETTRIQEMTTLVSHIICEHVDEVLGQEES